MSEPKPKFTLIDDTPPAASPAPARDQMDAARQVLFVALRALSQRTLTAVTNLFSLILVVLVATLLARILDDPTTNRLAGVGGFAVFCLLIDLVRRKTQ
jgi:hypothetical protein